MNKKYITTSLMLAVLANGKMAGPLCVPETKASLANHLLIRKSIILLSEHSVVMQACSGELKTS
ncbi:MAG: hypothetical protein V4557_04985 [Bacteroidota bacterium]